MNLLCPNCQKMLTVPEQFAGQLMKCPLCNGTFTVPALPQPSAVPSAGPNDPGATFSPQTPPGPGDVYSVRRDAEPAAPPPPPPPPPSPPSFRPEPPPEPGLHAPPPPPDGVTLPPAPAPSTAPPEGYTHTVTIRLNPRVLQWVPPVALFLVFVLQFFPWVGVYPGGVPAAWQNAWQALYGGYGEDPNMFDTFHFYPSEKEREQDPEGKRKKDNHPGISVLTLFYLMLFFPTLAVTIAVMVLPFISVKLPPALEQLMPWRWGIVAVANLLTFMFLALQLLVGFSLETRVENAYDEEQAQREKDKAKPNTTEDQLKADAARGSYFDWLHRTWWLKMVVLLHLLALICAGLLFWISQRGEGRPEPRLQLQW